MRKKLYFIIYGGSSLITFYTVISKNYPSFLHTLEHSRCLYTKVLWRKSSITWAVASVFIFSKSSNVKNFSFTFPSFISSWIKLLKMKVNCLVWNNPEVPSTTRDNNTIGVLWFHFEPSLSLYQHTSISTSFLSTIVLTFSNFLLVLFHLFTIQLNNYNVP